MFHFFISSIIWWCMWCSQRSLASHLKQLTHASLSILSTLHSTSAELFAVKFLQLNVVLVINLYKYIFKVLWINYVWHDLNTVFPRSAQSSKKDQIHSKWFGKIMARWKLLSGTRQWGYFPLTHVHEIILSFRDSGLWVRAGPSHCRKAGETHNWTVMAPCAIL